MDIKTTAIPEVKIVRPARYGDHRGFFSEAYNRRALAEAGIEAEFVQDNHSYSIARGTLRGLHFQARRRPRPSCCGCCAARWPTSRSTAGAARRPTAAT